MAMTPMTLAIRTLGSLVAEEIRLLAGVRQLIDELREDLDSMRSFLHDAENQSESNQGIRTWVKQVRDLAYDAEDVVEEFLFSLSLPDGQGLANFLGNCFRYTRQLREQHQLAVEIRAIKKRIKAISERREAFSINRRSDPISIIQDGFSLRQAALYIDEADVVGIENPRSTMIEWLVEGEENLALVSVVGMGGIGKTTLVKKVYDNQIVCKWFHCQSWITVSKSFTLLELLQAMFKGFVEGTKGSSYMEIELMGESQLIKELRNYLSKRRYLVVLDDMWSLDAWEAVRSALPDHKYGSRIMFTTRLFEVAASAESSVHVLQLDPLQDEEAWKLFCMKAFRGNHKGVCPEELKSLSRSILKKCGGLPLAIVAVGGLLSKKNKVVSEWRKVHGSLAAEITSDGKLSNLEKILLLSYNDLPHHLKSCYLYMSAFPEDYAIKRMRIIRLWVAERFLEEKQGLTMEEVGESYLDELVNRNLVRVVAMDYFNRVVSCRLHDIMREILLIKSKEESLITDITDSNILRNDNVRRISIHANLDNLSSDGRFLKLRSLLTLSLRGAAPLSSTESLSSQGFRLLRVLEMENVALVQFPPTLVKLVLLRYLTLRGTEIKVIPDSIRKLKNLEVLDLKFSPVSSLPTGILGLKHLKELRGYYYAFKPSAIFADTYGMAVPRGFGMLTSLQKLGSVDVDENGTLVRELGKLTQLRRLGILGLQNEYVADLCYILERLTHLTSLYMISTNANEVLELDREISPPKFLQHLYLKCSLPTLPKWISSLQHLGKLCLQNSGLSEDPLKALEALPSLVVLELRGAYNGEEIFCDANGYPKLKLLTMHLMERLKLIKVAKGAMPELRELHITTCQCLETVPFGIEHLKNLRSLQIFGMPLTFVQKIDKSNGEDSWKVEHIPTIINRF